jgi:large subunit ribosomal protein L21
MYAIIVDGGRQFKVEEGQELQIDFRGDLAAGAEVLFDRVLAIGGGDGATLGQPTIAGAAVKAEVLGACQGEKHVVQKMRRRKNSRRRTGHRQIFTKVKISKIQVA